MNNSLELLALSLQLNLMAFHSGLKVKILLQELVPSPLALTFAFTEFLDDSATSHILLGKVLKKLREYGSVLFGT